MQLVEPPRRTIRQSKVIVRVPIQRAAESCRPIPKRPVGRYQQHVLPSSLKMMTINFGIVSKDQPLMLQPGGPRQASGQVLEHQEEATGQPFEGSPPRACQGRGHFLRKLRYQWSQLALLLEFSSDRSDKNMIELL